MILTVTANPSVDQTMTVTELRQGEVHRATDSRVDPGGKGVNVSRALAANGVATLAVLPTGGSSGRLMEELLTTIGLPVRGVPVAEPVRANVTLVEPSGTTTKINEPGPVLTDDEVALLLSTVAAAYDESVAWVVVSGSLPRGMRSEVYRDLIELVHERGGRIAVDSSGPPLAEAVTAGPDLIKPNHEELEELVGRPLPTTGDIVEAARGLIAAGVAAVLVSLGRHGALLVTADQIAHAAATVDRPLSTVGAGDCALAGYLFALTHGGSPVDALRAAVAFGSAAVTLPGSEVPSPADIARIQVMLTHDPDRTTSLTD